MLFVLIELAVILVIMYYLFIVIRAAMEMTKSLVSPTVRKDKCLIVLFWVFWGIVGTSILSVPLLALYAVSIQAFQ